MNIHEEDYPYSIYKRPEGDELLDAHNDIIAVFDPHTEPEIERMIAAAPEILKLLYQAHEEMASIVEYNDLYIDDEKTAARICRNIEAVIQQIDGDAKEALTERIDAILDRIKGEDDDDA